MRHLIFLDSGVLGLAANPKAKAAAEAARCRAWIASQLTAGAGVLIPEIADYEVRRELILNALPKTRSAILRRLATLPTRPTPSLRRLDAMREDLGFVPLTTAAMLRAAEFWALVRRTGAAGAGPRDLDADCILAGQAATAGNVGDRLTIATTNVRHFRRFPGIDAREWPAISP